MKRSGKKPRLRCRPSLLLLALVAVMWACVGVHGESRARLVNNGYEGVVVGMSPNVKEEDGPALVEALKGVLAETSAALFLATDGRAYFRSVTILIPRSWSSVKVTGKAGSESFENSDIRVDMKHPVYQHQPYTEQPGGCGDPGQYIHLTPTYLLEDSEAKWWGPRGKALLLEWAKLRWGVFDELGYPGDPTFPPNYVEYNGEISPTICTNARVSGRYISQSSYTQKKRSKRRAKRSSGPEEQCCFIPNPSRNQTASSSLLSYFSIMNDKITHFCGGPGREHNTEAPTKQNLYCKQRSAWDVISDHPDFKNNNNPSIQTFPGVQVLVVQQADATYALVLDYSGSMKDHNRVQKLRMTARRWLLHEVDAGSSVAIINFTKTAKLVYPLTKMTGEAARKALADAIGTNADGGTSIGAGLKLAVTTVLANKQNPVILLITDGRENESPHIKDVENEVVSSGARVVTVAFGQQADDKLETVAEVTGGKTFTVLDTDEGQMLEDAFQGALTFQPPPPAAARTVTIYEKEYQAGGSEQSSTFNVDFTVGRNLTLKLETNPTVTSAPILIGPDRVEYTNAKFDVDASSWILMVPLAQEGKWTWKVNLSGQQRSSLIVRVTSLPRDVSVEPIITRAWINQGAKEVQATVDKVIIFAEVKQGNKPVVHADVRAIVTPPNEHDPAEIYKLLDNGQGADTLAGDGIYSRYMTKYPSIGRYSVKAQVTDGGTALINSGFHTTPQRRRRRQVTENTKEGEKENQDFIDFFMERPTVCCGSIIPVSQNANATGSFERITSGGSVKIASVPQDDILAPAGVRDLQVQLADVGWVADTLPTDVSVILTWTAPGDDLDSGIVSGYEMRMATSKSDLLERNFNTTDISSNFSSSSSSSWHVVDLSGLAIDVEGGTPLLFNLTLTFTNRTTYFALRAWDDVNLVSDMSNIATLYLEVDRSPAPSTGRIPTWAVVVIVVAALCLVGLVMLVTLLRMARKRTSERQKLLAENRPQ